jgi:hypothetical protein
VRKTVTVVFADVVGSTALGESRDPERVRAEMGRWFETARATIERHGGTIEKFAGDAVMAVFGVPVAREDDALRAVRAAEELRAAQLRIGVNTPRIGDSCPSLVLEPWPQSRTPRAPTRAPHPAASAPRRPNPSSPLACISRTTRLLQLGRGRR